MTLAVQLLLFCFSVGVPLSRWHQATSELHALQGEWECLRYEENGKDWTVAGTSVAIRHNKLSIEIQGPAKLRPDEDTWSISICPWIEPKSIDLRQDSKAAPFLRDLHYLGIYSLEGDRLRVCFAPGKTGRPDAFETKPRTQRTLIVLRKKTVRR